MENPHEFMLESFSLVKELQHQLKNVNDRMELLRKEIGLVRKEGVEESNKTIAK